MITSELEQLITQLAKMPGLGKRSARRAVLHMLNQKESFMLPLAGLMEKVAEQIVGCETCHNLDTHSPCAICTGVKRDPSVICVVEEVADLWAFERSEVFKGHYHVLGGVLSAMEGKGPAELNLNDLVSRASDEAVKEVIVATNATVDGQTTAHYITQLLQDANVKVSRLAQGVPIGGELDYLDDGTLMAALESRKEYV